jgi:hypothetical protein
MVGVASRSARYPKLLPHLGKCDEPKRHEVKSSMGISKKDGGIAKIIHQK